MSQAEAKPKRYIGLDVHKHYLVAAGVDADQNEVLAPHRVALTNLGRWVETTLTTDDALVLEMSTNSFQLYDDLVAHAHSVTLVHPPHVALITQAPVKVDRKAALTLAKLHAARLLPAVWVPPLEVRDSRALVAQRQKMVRLATQAKNRLHALLHRRRLGLPEQGGPFAPENRAWWLTLPLSALEKVRLQSDLNTLDFAQAQLSLLETGFKTIAADERLPLLIQLPGISLINAVALLAAIGDIRVFPTRPTWSAMLAWADGSMTAARPTAPAASPKRAGATCGPPWSRRLIPPFRCMPTGKLNSTGSNRVWASPKPL